MSSIKVGFLPYINIPTRYILADSHIIPKNDTYRSTTESSDCHTGMPNGMRAIITMGEVKGMIEVHKASPELGSCTTLIDMIRARMMGTIATVCSCEASCMLSTAEPMAAYIDE